MKTFNGDEAFIAGKPDPTIEQAQQMANTQDEDQDEDPGTSAAEKARAWKLAGLGPEDFATDETDESAADDFQAEERDEYGPGGKLPKVRPERYTDPAELHYHSAEESAHAELCAAARKALEFYP